MLNAIQRIINTEISFFQDVLELEKKKRTCILSADGNGIQKVTSEIETLLLKISHYEEEREQLIKSETGIADSLESIISIYKLKDSAGSELLQKKSAELKELLVEIRGIVKENEQLLNRNTDTIHRLLKGFGQNSDKQYAPSYMKTAPRPDSVLISANA